MGGLRRGAGAHEDLSRHLPVGVAAGHSEGGSRRHGDGHRLGRMGEKGAQLSDQELADLEREIRAERKFSLAGAIGRLGGGNLLKGASPVTRLRQAELEIKLFLEEHLADAEGALRVVLKRQVRDSDILLAAGYEHPLGALAQITERILSSEESLQSFVHEVDAEWGRMYLERPQFEEPGRPAAQTDPYTFASVRGQLSGLRDKLHSALPVLLAVLWWYPCQA